MLSSSSPAYYPYEGKNRLPSLFFPGSLMTKVSFECLGCGEESAAGRVRWLCVGCAFFEGQSCALCEKCVQRVEKRDQLLLSRLHKVQPSHKKNHSYVRVLVEDTDEPETEVYWYEYIEQ